MIKLVVSDMDGTLIDRDERLSDKAVEMARRLKERGIRFTIATGRIQPMAQSYADALGIEIPYIVSNGATIVHGSKVLQRNTVPASGLRQLIDAADREGMSVIYTWDGHEWVYRTTPWIVGQRQRFDRYHDEYRFTDEDWRTRELEKVTIMDDVRDGRIARVEQLCQELGGPYGYTRYTDKAVEIVEKYSNKGTALCKLTDLLGISLNEVLAIGDHLNDVEMLQLSGCGAAVANAIDEAKSVADYVCEQPCIDGVLEAVEKFALNDG